MSPSCVQLFATPWTVAYQVPPSMGFSRQECWSGLPFPSPGDLPDPGIEPASPALEGGFFTTEPLGKPNSIVSGTLFINKLKASVYKDIFLFIKLFICLVPLLQELSISLNLAR